MSKRRVRIHCTSKPVASHVEEEGKDERDESEEWQKKTGEWEVKCATMPKKLRHGDGGKKGVSRIGNPTKAYSPFLEGYDKIQSVELERSFIAAHYF